MQGLCLGKSPQGEPSWLGHRTEVCLLRELPSAATPLVSLMEPEFGFLGCIPSPSQRKHQAGLFVAEWVLAG